jgi:DHA2 family multidrug resistance protein-like MFS transporter
VAAVLLIPPLITSIDNTLMYVCVPVVAHALQASGTETLAIADSYSVVLAGFLVTAGAIADRWGRHLVVTVGVAGFGLASLVAGLATAPWQMIAGRAAMGLFAAALGPSTLAMLRERFESEAARSRAVAGWSAMFAVGAAAGPLLGAWFVGIGWWRGAFFINVPLCVVFIAGGPLLRLRGRRAPVRVSWAGLAVLPLGIALLSTGVLGLATSWWAVAVVLIAAGLAGVALFVRRQLGASRPAVDLRVLGRRRFRTAVGANFADIFALAGLVIVVSEVFQWSGMSAFVLVVTAVPAVVVSVAAGLSAGALPRVVREAWWMIPAGMWASAVGCLVLAMLGSRALGAFTPVLAVAFVCVGLGVGVAETLTNTDVVSGADEDQVGAQSAISETAYELGSAFGVLVIGLAATVGARMRAGGGAAGFGPAGSSAALTGGLVWAAYTAAGVLVLVGVWVAGERRGAGAGASPEAVAQVSQK